MEHEITAKCILNQVLFPLRMTRQSMHGEFLMKTAPINPIRDKVNQFKEEQNPKSLFIITSGDKIIFASAPVAKILRSDPTGSSFFNFVHPAEKDSIKAKLESGENVETTRMFQLGAQTFSVDLNTIRELVEGRIIGLTIIKNITIVRNATNPM
jgi:hypothetical protein